jgi:uncharacterized membrane protein
MCKQIFICITVLAMLPSCTREVIQDNTVCFETQVLPIFQSNCTQSGCHNAQDKKDGYDLTNYAGIVKKGIRAGDYKGSKMYQVLIGGEELMPPAPNAKLSVDQITTIALWIEEGAQETSCSSSTCDTTNITYSGSIKPIIETYCLGCHSGSSPSGNISYTSYAGVKANVDDGSFSGSINHLPNFSQMPKNANKLSACQLEKIKNWIDKGALDN